MASRVVLHVQMRTDHVEDGARVISALFVATGGIYFNRPDVDPWDEARDARKYAGPHPVVAHPPCSRWCKPLAFVNQTRYGYMVGADEGCFASALASVRRFGGVLEHPANSAAFDRFDLPRPNSPEWESAPCADGPGWVASVYQGAYGHPARKRTWLYAFGRRPIDLDPGNPDPRALTSWLQRTTSGLPRLGKKEAKATPPAFADLLISIAGAAAAP